MTDHRHTYCSIVVSVENSKATLAKLFRRWTRTVFRLLMKPTDIERSSSRQVMPVWTNRFEIESISWHLTSLAQVMLHTVGQPQSGNAKRFIDDERNSISRSRSLLKPLEPDWKRSSFVSVSTVWSHHSRLNESRSKWSGIRRLHNWTWRQTNLSMLYKDMRLLDYVPSSSFLLFWIFSDGTISTLDQHNVYRTVFLKSKSIKFFLIERMESDRRRRWRERIGNDSDSIDISRFLLQTNDQFLLIVHHSSVDEIRIVQWK